MLLATVLSSASPGSKAAIQWLAPAIESDVRSGGAPCSVSHSEVSPASDTAPQMLPPPAVPPGSMPKISTPPGPAPGIPQLPQGTAT